MFKVGYRIRPELNKPGGIVATEVIPAFMPVWTLDYSQDVVLEFDALKKITELEFDLIKELGFVHLPYSNLFVVPCFPFKHMRLASKVEGREANLTSLFDGLVASRTIRKNEELVCPVDFDQSLAWKRRMCMSDGWKREGERPANPTLRSYIRYVHR